MGSNGEKEGRMEWGEWGHISLFLPLRWWSEGSRDLGEAASLGRRASVWTPLRQLEQRRTQDSQLARFLSSARDNLAKSE